MSLNRRNVGIRFTGGLAEEADPKALPSSRLETLENGVFDKIGRISKRHGFTSLSTTVAGSSSDIDDGQALLTYGDELLAADPDTLYSYDAVSARWVDKGTLVSCHVTSRGVAGPMATTGGAAAADGATHTGSGLQAFAWEEFPFSGDPAIRYAIIDSATGATVVASTEIVASGIKPRVVVFGNTFLFSWINRTDTRLYFATLPVGNPTATISGTAVTTATSDTNGLLTNYAYDLAVITTQGGPFIYLAYRSRAAVETLVLRRYNVNTPTVLAAEATFPDEKATCLGIFGHPYDRGVVVVYYTGTGVMFRNQPEALVNASNATLPPLAFGVVESIPDVIAVTGVATSSTAISMKFFYTDKNGGTVTKYRTRTAGVSGYSYRISLLGIMLGIPWSEITAAPAAWLRSVSLSGKAFAYGGRAYVPCGHSSETQSTYFLADENAKIVARVLPALSGVEFNASVANTMLMLPSPAQVDATTWRLSWLSSPDPNDDDFPQPACSVVAVDFDLFEPAQSYRRAELGGNLHVGGGLLWAYDGQTLAEHGFLLYPEGVSVPNAGSTYNYQYAVCYEWRDARGVVHRSAPSVAAAEGRAAVISGGSTVAVTIPTLRVTNRTGTSIGCYVYRTENNGSIFYRAGSVQNSTTADAVTFTDTTTDAVLITRPQLYTTGGVLENIAPPPVSGLAVHRNRIFALDSTTPLSVWPSKVTETSAPVEFSDALAFAVDPRGGDITAIAGLDETLVVFKRAAVMYVSGEGPDDTGRQDSWSDAKVASLDVGCVNPRSVVAVPQGLMFQGAKGIYLLDRGLNVSFVGAAVEDSLAGQTVTSGALLEEENQVRFTLGNRKALVFDYGRGQWSVFTGVAAVDSAIWRGSHVYIRADGNVLEEGSGFADDGSHVALKLVTAWLQLADLQGFQRVYRALILGEYKSAHRLVVRVATDFNPAASQEKTITPDAVATYGADATYGSGTPYGGEFPLYQWRVNITKRRSQALRLEIEDAPPASGSPGESMNLSGLTLVVGVESREMRVPRARTVGG